MTLTIIALILMAVSIWYIPFRLKSLLGLGRAWLWHILSAFIVAGYMLIITSGIYTRDNAAAAFVYNVMGLLFVFFIYLFFFLLVTHPLSLFKRVSKRLPGIGATAIPALLVIYGFINAQSFTLTDYELPVKALTQSVKIVHVPDIHLGAQRGEAYLRKLIAVINEQKPDIVLYNGDLVDSNIALKPKLFSLFKDVSAEQYFTLGNHEYYIDTNKALQFVAGAGIRILRSEIVETHGIQLIGMEYMNADKTTWDAHSVNNLTIQEELPRIVRDGAKPSILVHHSPVGMRYAAEGNIDVMLSGHTHGGQFVPGTLLVKYPFPMYAGQYQIGKTILLVSRGVGTFGPWMRLGAGSEVQIVNLIPAKSE